MFSIAPLQSQRLLPVAGLLVAVLLLAACGGEPKPAKKQAVRSVIAVELASPQRADWPRRITASGAVAPWQESVIGAEVGGMRIEEVRVDVGQVVKKGELLARFDEELLRADLAQQTAGVAQAQASFARAKADSERAALLDGTGSISQQDILQFRTAALTAAAALELAQAQRDVQALRLRRARVLSPDDGIISGRSATAGSTVASGQELFRLIRGARLEWRAEVRGEALALLKPGMEATLRRPDGGRVLGRIRSVAPMVNEATRNGLVYVDLPADSALAGGMYLSGEFDVGSAPALFLPESSLVLRDGNSYVMKVDKGQLVREIKVATGRRQGQDIEVLEGVAANEQFVRSGGSFLADGDLVRVPPPAAARPEPAR